jgi:glyoxylate reductase
MAGMKIFMTRAVPAIAASLLREQGHEIVVGAQDRTLSKTELIEALRNDRYDAVLSQLTDHIDDEIFSAAGPQCKVFANYAVGFDNIDLAAARVRGIAVTNTPSVLTNTVAEHAMALMLAIAHRVAEGDRFVRAGSYEGWAPLLLLGTDLAGKTLGVIGLGGIGTRVVHAAARGFDMRVIYNDVRRSESLEQEYGAQFMENADDICRAADFISLHVPLLPSTRHLIDGRRLGLMKRTAYLINTSRGPVVDEAALVAALQMNVIAGAALDVFENEPHLASGLAELHNVILTPHIGSATRETRDAMAAIAARNIIAVLGGDPPLNPVTG